MTSKFIHNKKKHSKTKYLGANELRCPTDFLLGHDISNLLS